ncbi:MAG TPA: glycoside hydrolase family 3 N-terminal domain-containing protein [Prolixibacteraceae bacterium]|nr:glycoside hydrolase family 3 N-terminal domain-containing protein [Prolixibacteraceae bacterium]
MKKFVFSFCFISLIMSKLLFANDPPFLNESAQWADSVLSKMTLDEKIGQLMMVTSKPWLGDEQKANILEAIEKYKVGGVLFLKSSPYELAGLANDYQKASGVPLFIALDAENGLSFRMDSVISYPNLIALGATHSDSLIYRMGREVGQQCRELGINVDFAPVGDVNSNPENPVINYRSFGENVQRVARKSCLLASGLQDERILVTIKHFPGHGNTSTDSHVTLPKIDRDYRQLDSIDFIPFKMCIENGVNGIMSAHIQLPEIDKTKRPATLSKKIMTDILRDSLHFKGLVFSDGMNMKGITMYSGEGNAAVEAFKAGVDVIEFVLNPDKVAKSVKKAIQSGYLTEKMIDEKCHRVLLAKKWVGLDHYQPTLLSNLGERIRKPSAQLTSRLLTEQSLTVIQNNDSLLPLRRLDTLKIASFSIGSAQETDFQKGLDRYTSVDHYSIAADATPIELAKVLNDLQNYNLVIVGVHGTRLTPSKRYSITDNQLLAVQKICERHRVILTFFSNPYSLALYSGMENADAIVVGYGETPNSQDLASQLIFGAIGTNATLPVSVNEKFPAGFGVELKGSDRLKYTLPEEVGIDSRLLQRTIDSLANIGLSEKMFPGCQVLVAKNGKVVFHRAYGFLTYDTIEPVQENDLYDLASVSKISGPLPLLMKLYEDSVIRLDEPFSTYWLPFRKSNKENITLREILAHQAGLKSGISFHNQLLKEEENKGIKIFSDAPSEEYPIRVSSNLYARKDCRQRLFDEIRDSGLSKEKKYVYSDLGFCLFPDLITRLTGVPYENYLYQNFFYPLGINRIMYNPYRHLPIAQIAPTERDDLFRKEQLRGFVHDEDAALLGGVSGNAGLFGNVNDLAKIMQFYLQKGHYGDCYFVSEKTFEEFNRVQFPRNNNRRALGFDKPYLDNKQRSASDAYPAPGVSPSSFGHSGYTGGFTWADPNDQLLYIFLTNRVYPTRENRKLIDSDFRSRLLQSIIDCENSFFYGTY